MILYYLLGLASAFIFSEWGGFLPTVLIVGVAAALVVEASIKRIYVLAFVLGIFHDLINGTLLGMTAIYLLIAVWGMLFVQKKFRKSFWLTILVALTFGLGYGVVSQLLSYVSW